MLLEKADVQGYLTTEDLMEFYPEGDEDNEHLTAINGRSSPTRCGYPRP